MATKKSGVEAEGSPTVIKKYANRRLYNTASSSYVTLDHLCQMVKDDEDFVVYDAKTGEDITRSVLTQIIVEEEGKGQNLLPISFLRQLIGLYGDQMQWVVPNYLDYTMQAFAKNQDQMRSYFSETVTGMFPFNSFEEIGKQNMAMFERTLRMFQPPGIGTEADPDPSAAPSANKDATVKALQAEVAELKRQLAAARGSSVRDSQS